MLQAITESDEEESRYSYVPSEKKVFIQQKMLVKLYVQQLTTYYYPPRY